MNEIQQILETEPDTLLNRLGCIVTHERDPRNKNYPLKAVMPKKASKRTKRSWRATTVLNQGDTPSCVGHAWAHRRLGLPIARKKGEIVNPFELYDLARDNDEFEGNDYEGSSTLGGAKASMIKGWLKEYRWGTTMEELFYFLLEGGSVVVGSWWHWDMFLPNADFTLNVSGGRAGGHEYIFDAIDMKKKMIRILNSWGKEWGDKGHAWITFEQAEILLFQEGDMCFPIESI